MITSNLKIISDSRICAIIAKGPKYRFPMHIDFQKCREKIAATLNEFCKMVMFLVRRLMVFIFLNLFNLLKCPVMLMTLILVIRF